jgi:hypothetical protein
MPVGSPQVQLEHQKPEKKQTSSADLKKSPVRNISGFFRSAIMLLATTIPIAAAAEENVEIAATGDNASLNWPMVRDQQQETQQAKPEQVEQKLEKRITLNIWHRTEDIDKVMWEHSNKTDQTNILRYIHPYVEEAIKLGTSLLPSITRVDANPIDGSENTAHIERQKLKQHLETETGKTTEELSIWEVWAEEGGDALLSGLDTVKETRINLGLKLRLDNLKKSRIDIGTRTPIAMLRWRDHQTSLQIRTLTKISPFLNRPFESVQTGLEWESDVTIGRNNFTTLLGISNNHNLQNYTNSEWVYGNISWQQQSSPFKIQVNLGNNLKGETRMSVAIVFQLGSSESKSNPLYRQPRSVERENSPYPFSKFTKKVNQGLQRAYSKLQRRPQHRTGRS